MKKIINFFIIISIINIFNIKNIEAKEEVDRLLWSDHFQKVFEITLFEGRGLFNEDYEERYNLNEKIINKEESNYYSLYDRFGPEIAFVPYYGERKFDFSIVDRLYNNFKINNKKFTFSISDLFKKLASVENHQVYSTRPDIATENEYLKRHFKDPRREQYNEFSYSGGTAALGNFYLSIGNYITQIISYMLDGNKISNLFIKNTNYIYNSKMWEYFKNIIFWFLNLLVLFYAFYLIKSIKQIFNGNLSLNKIIYKTLGYFISLGLIYSFLNNPTVLNNFVNNFINFTDSLFSESINNTSNSEVVKSSSNKNVISASLWEKTVLIPWSKGMFNKEYKDMYTMYSEYGNQFEQSNDDIHTVWEDKTPKFNSKETTGDIKIPLGGGNEVRNWAALAWSTQSIYHTDAVPTDKTSGDNKLTEEKSFPVATFSPNNSKLYIDNFRWIDAKLNISYRYLSTNKKDINIENGRIYTESFIKYGFESLFLSLLLFPFIPLIYKKLYSLIKIILISIILIYRFIMYIINPDLNDFSILNNLKNIGKNLYYYFWFSLISNLMIIIYLLLIDKSIYGWIGWIIMSFVIIKNSNKIYNFNKINNILHNSKIKIKNKLRNIKRFKK